MAVDGILLCGRRRGKREQSHEVSNRFNLSVENEHRLTRDGTAEPVSRGQILRRNRDRETSIFPDSS